MLGSFCSLPLPNLAKTCDELTCPIEGEECSYKVIESRPDISYAECINTTSIF